MMELLLKLCVWVTWPCFQLPNFSYQIDRQLTILFGILDFDNFDNLFCLGELLYICTIQ